MSGRSEPSSAAAGRPPPGSGARLVQFENGRRTKSRPIGSREIRIGRDPSSDWVVAYANVSRHHAAVRPDGDRNVVLDLGSSRGVRVNGEPIGQAPRALAPGDVIELSDEVLLLYEEGPETSRTPWLVTLLALIVLAVAWVGLYDAARTTTPAVSAPPAGAEPASPAAPRDPARNRGPDSSPTGTHPRMPPASVPQHLEFKIDFLAARGGWYACARVPSCGGLDGSCGPGELD